VTLSVLVFQHEEHDGPGYLGEALLQHRAKLDVIRLDKGEAIPDLLPYDMLLIMGGVMNVYQEDIHPWLVEETRAIRQAVKLDKAVLGVCLGGQLLAKALDAPVRVGAATEIGLTPISLTKEGKADPLFEGLSQIEAVEWHDDTFDIPTGAVALASSRGCDNQAFRFGERAYGLQFHPEVSPEMLAEWIKEAGNSVERSAFQRAVESKVSALQDQADCLIDNFVRRCSSLSSH
jgi:GMP synthase-like glutamine amidotransferase